MYTKGHQGSPSTPRYIYIYPVRGTSSADKLGDGGWLAGVHHHPGDSGVWHKESRPLLKCSWSRNSQTRGRDSSPQGARNRSEEMMELSGLKIPAQRRRRQSKPTGLCVYFLALRAQPARNPAGSRPDCEPDSGGPIVRAYWGYWEINPARVRAREKALSTGNGRFPAGGRPSCSRHSRPAQSAGSAG